METAKQDGQEKFRDGDQVLLHASELPSTKEIEAEKFRKAIEDAFKTVQQIELNDDTPETLVSSDPVQKARLYTLKSHQRHTQEIVSLPIMTTPLKRAA